MERKDIDMVVGWFKHIRQIATDRKTLTGAVMEDWAALDEIAAKASFQQGGRKVPGP